MPRKRHPPLPPLVRLITLRPNGLELRHIDLAFTSIPTVRAMAADERRAVRNERGWTPAFRVIVTHRDITPFEARDETELYLGSEANL